MQVVDDRGVTVRLAHKPTRIVSLVPSATETLFDLGLGDAVVGCTRFCVHPADAVRALPKVGGTKDVDPAKVAALRPDLIVGNCEENTREAFEALASVAPLYAAFPRTVHDAVHDLSRLGTLLGVPERAQRWVDQIQASRARIVAQRATRSVAYLIWRDPWMSASGDTYIHSVLAELGLRNVFAHAADRFPTITAAQLAAADPELVMLSSEPFPFRAKHADELATATGLDRTRFVAVDGEAFTWHGTRMARAFTSLADALPRGFDPVT